MGFIEIFTTIIIATLLHEFGHMVGAKIVGIRISEVSLGFGPTITKLSCKGTTYKIAWFLLGEYVRPEKDDEDYLTYPRISRLIFTVSGLVMSIFILPIVCILVISILQGGHLNIFSAYANMFKYLYSHPLSYLYNGIMIFPTITFENKYYNFISCLGEVSLFLGVINTIPIPVTDGGQVLMTLLENKVTDFKINPFKYRAWGYLVILFIFTLPIIIALVQSISNSWPLLLIIAYVVYKFITVKV